MRYLSLALEHDASWKTMQREALEMHPVIPWNDSIDELAREDF